MTLPSIKEKITGSFIGAAVGDALGWPCEDRSGRVDRESHVSSNGFGNEFVSWTRRCGSRFQSFEEPIDAGNYSDDTQLILSTTRSLRCGEDWWDCFTQVELPLWLTYQRGGGGATKRAAQLWLISTAPWTSTKESMRYFEAGGNGVCMRLLPHVIRNLWRNEFAPIASEIILNGICTHGHPRALVGGLAHGYALWLAFRQHDVLNYGELIREVIEQASVWSELREDASEQTGWRQSFSNEELDAYRASWARSVKEMIELLTIANAAMELGALSTGHETLEKMGAFDRRVNGSGTITAAASIFLASRYAVSPLQGVRVAATAHGADTDTLASMTASLLGALGGEEWLSTLREQVQDSKYLRKLASSLTSEDKPPAVSNRPVHRVSKTATSALLTTLEKSQPTARATLPDGRQVLVVAVEQLNSRSRNWEAYRWRLETDDGQTLFICRLRRK